MITTQENRLKTRKPKDTNSIHGNLVGKTYLNTMDKYPVETGGLSVYIDNLKITVLTDFCQIYNCDNMSAPTSRHSMSGKDEGIVRSTSKDVKIQSGVSVDDITNV